MIFYIPLYTHLFLISIFHSQGGVCYYLVMRKTIALILVCLYWIDRIQSIQDITDYGAIRKVDTVAVQKLNSQAITTAILKANSSSTDRSVRIPKGVFYSMPVVL